MYSGYGIAFDGKVSSSFGSAFARNVVIFGIGNCSCQGLSNTQVWLVLDWIRSISNTL